MACITNSRYITAIYLKFSAPNALKMGFSGKTDGNFQMGFSTPRQILFFLG